MLDFLRQVASVTPPEVLLFSKLVFTFVGKLDFFGSLSHTSSSAILLCMSGLYHIFLLSFHPHSIFEHQKQPSLFSGSICCFKFLRKKKEELVFSQLKGTKTTSRWTVMTRFKQSSRLELDIANICILVSAKVTKHRHGYNHVIPLWRFILKHVALITPDWITSATE